jgi:TetR/AcrR family fatty acid metabolism transcriptional regulator
MAKKRGEKYEAILNAAAKVFARYGYHQTQVSKIAKEAQVAEGTIYLYFRNKEDILISLFDEKMGGLIALAEQKVHEQSDVINKLKTLVSLHFFYLSQDPDLAMVTKFELRQLELRQLNPVTRDKINELLKRHLHLIDHIIDSGIKQRVFHPEIDPLLARYMIFGTLDETITSWLMKEQKFDLMSKVEPVLKLLLGGLKSYSP